MFARFYAIPSVCALELLGGVDIEYSGDEIPLGDSAVVFGNHVSNVDATLMLGYLLRKGMAGSLKFIAKKSLQYVPFYGWAFHMAGQGIYISRDWDRDRAHIESSFDDIANSTIPCSIGLMPEGTRITAKKRAESLEFCKQRQIEPLYQVLVPRPKGFRAVIQYLKGSKVKYIYDFTLGYVDGVIRLRDFAFSSIRGKKILVNIKRIPIDEVPSEDAALQKWLMEWFYRKDKLIANMKKNRSFEGEPIIQLPLQFRVVTESPSVESKKNN